MTWKVKIHDISIPPSWTHFVLVYFSLEMQEGNEWITVHKKAYEVDAMKINGNITQQKQFVKDFIREVVDPMIKAYEASETLKDLIGYEEII